MAILDEFVAQIEDPELRARVAAEAKKLAEHKQFGLVFEEHLPECTPLWDIPVKKGSKVALRAGQVNDFYTVLKIEDGVAACLKKDKSGTAEFKVEELVSVAEIGEVIFPYLKFVNSVCNAPDSDLWHTLIEADNYHALQLLGYLYAGKVDCIYIDPPYNTGARDWKYNNNYVDSNDRYRHSKWLSMMQRRLKLAKILLKEKTGIIVIAIDDNELCSLGMLLDQVFKGYKKFCITVVHNPNGNQGKNFGITNEFLFFVLPSEDQLLSLENRTEEPDIRPLRDVSGNSNLRTDARNCFYPVYVKGQTVVGFGDVCDPSFHPGAANIQREDGILEIYPVDANGTEKKWVFARNTVESILGELHVEWNRSRGIWDVIRYKTHFTYKSVWSKKAYNANSYGSKLLNAILRGKRFDYPKSLYAVEECLRAVCGENRDALIVDFFAGSGTTLHAVNLLNAEDGGHRRCILVTNNEVSESEAKDLAAKGYHPGDEEWEKLGVARYVTWPRTVCSIEGHDVNGDPLKGSYLGSDLPMADGFGANAVFFKLGFLDGNAVALGKQFRELLPLLWMKAGAVGKCPAATAELPAMLVLPENRFAVLLDEARYLEFAEKTDRPDIDMVFIVTDSASAFCDMAAGLRTQNCYQLYRDYLDHFRINSVRSEKR